MFDSLIIRQAISQDAPAVFLLLQSGFIEYGRITEQTNLEALLETVEDVQREIETNTVFIAIIDDVIVGTVRLEVHGEEAYLSRFAVDINRRNSGVGKSLINIVDKFLMEEKIKKVTLHTASKHILLMRFYYGRGFYTEKLETDRGYLRATLVKEYKNL